MMEVEPDAFSREAGVLGRKRGWKTQRWLGSGGGGIPRELRMILVGKTSRYNGVGVGKDWKEM